MRYFRVQATLTAKDGVVANNVTNTFHFRTSDVADSTEDICTDLVAAVKGFYNGNTGDANGKALGGFIGPAISRGGLACVLKATEMADLNPATPEGSPDYVEGFTLTPSDNAGQVPEEVAVVIQLQSAEGLIAPVDGPGGTRPRSRYTGRLYIGPLNNSAIVTAAATGHATLSDELYEACRSASDRLQSLAEAGAGGALWSVYSRVTPAMAPIFRVKVDNAFDTQRRRGQRATGGATYTID